MGVCCGGANYSSDQNAEEARIAQARLEAKQRSLRKKEAKEAKEKSGERDPLSKQSLEEEVEEAFKLYDADGNGTLDVEEATKFLTMWMEKHAKSEEAKQITFDDLDADGNGEIDRQELTQFLFDQRMLHSEVF